MREYFSVISIVYTRTYLDLFLRLAPNARARYRTIILCVPVCIEDGKFYLLPEGSRPRTALHNKSAIATYPHELHGVAYLFHRFPSTPVCWLCSVRLARLSAARSLAGSRLADSRLANLPEDYAMVSIYAKCNGRGTRDVPCDARLRPSSAAVAGSCLPWLLVDVFGLRRGMGWTVLVVVLLCFNRLLQCDDTGLNKGTLWEQGPGLYTSPLTQTTSNDPAIASRASIRPDHTRNHTRYQLMNHAPRSQRACGSSPERSPTPFTPQRNRLRYGRSFASIS